MAGKYIFRVMILVLMGSVLGACTPTRSKVTKDFPEMRKIYTDSYKMGQQQSKGMIDKQMSKNPALGGSLRPMIPIRRSETVEWAWIPNATDKAKDRFVEGHRVWYVRQYASWWKDKDIQGMIRVDSLPKHYGIPFKRVAVPVENSAALPNGTLSQTDLARGVREPGKDAVNKPAPDFPAGAFN